MNENIDLTKILKGCPRGTKLYSLVHGEVEFQKVDIGFKYSIIVKLKNGIIESFASNGKLLNNYDGECVIFPSKDQRDWSKFTAPWYKKEKFDPKTLVPFAKVLIWKDLIWMPTMFTFLNFSLEYPRMRYDTIAVKVIPYNDETKHLVGTSEEAPEYYRYWDDCI